MGCLIDKSACAMLVEYSEVARLVRSSSVLRQTWQFFDTALAKLHF